MKFFGKKKENGQEEKVVKRSVFSLDEQPFSLKTKENFNFFLKLSRRLKEKTGIFLLQKKML